MQNISSQPLTRTVALTRGPSHTIIDKTNLHREAPCLSQKMPSNNSSWGAVIAAHIQSAKAMKDGQNEGAYTTFTKLGSAYARFPLKASPKQIREANHLMLQQGYCYLRLFAVKYRRQIAACLGANPTFTKVEQQLGQHPVFRRGDSFVTAFISGPFQAHIAKSKKEIPFYLGTLRRLNSGVPIRVGSTQPPMLLAPPQSTEVAMIDVPMLPATDETDQVVQTSPVPANQMTIAQHRMAQASWQAIQLARQDSKITSSELHDLEERFDSLVGEPNRADNRITSDTEGGMKFLYEHHHGISIQASQFSGLVHQQITRTAEGDAKIVALQVANQSNNDNLEIQAQIVQAEKNHSQQRDGAIDNWVRGRNQDISELTGDTTLTKNEVGKIQIELQWQKARNNRIAIEQSEALARMEKKIAEAIHSTNNRKEL